MALLSGQVCVSVVCRSLLYVGLCVCRSLLCIDLCCM